MLSADEIQALRDVAVQITTPLNEFIIADICERIVRSGKFTATAEYMAFRAESLGVHWVDLRREIAKRLNVSEDVIDLLYNTAAQRAYDNEAGLLLGNNYTPFESNLALMQMTNAARELAERDLWNVTQTMGMIDPTGRELPLREFYGATMDFVHHNVSNGTMDYNSAVRLASTQLAERGITAIGYESGVVTSLEAAVRRNVMGGLGLLTEKIGQYNHDALGCDGWEISAHAMSAPDHEPIQGRQYSDSQYEALNNLLVRRIGTLNCGHNAFPIILGVNEPQYTDAQLRKLKEDNANGVVVDGKHYTLYDATQHQRAIERNMRKWKRQNVAAEASGDNERALTTQARMMSTRTKYESFSDAAGLRTQSERMRVTGFKWNAQSGIREYTSLSGMTSSNGITIGRLSGHSIERAVSYGIPAANIREALKSPLKIDNIQIDELGRSSQRFIGNLATVNINPENGTIITMWKTGERLRKRYGGG